MNKRILVISDTHIPYHHRDLFPFLKAIKKEYKPDRVIHIGDEVDNHAMSYHDTDPDLLSAGDELRASRKYVKELEAIFPKMDLLESNHGSLYYRKSKTHGIPAAALKTYNELWEVGPGWKWHFELIIKMSSGQKCYFHHGIVNDIAKVSTQRGMCAVQGHFHEKFRIDYWANSEQLCWGMNVGSFADIESLAMAYGRNNLKRPIVGTGIILDGLPRLLPMVLKIQRTMEQETAMNRLEAEDEMRRSEANVCAIPLTPSRVVSMTEYQNCIVRAKNKGQMLRCCFRVLSSMGYNGNVNDPKFWEKIKEYIEDYPTSP